MLLKSLKHLFTIYRDTCKGIPKETGLQSYQIPKRVLSGCGNQSQPLNQPYVCLGIHCLIQYLQLHVPGLRLTVFSVTLFLHITLNFCLDLCLQTAPWLWCFLQVLIIWISWETGSYFMRFFSPLNHGLQTKMVPKSLQTSTSPSGFSCFYCFEASDSFVNNSKSF